MSRVCTVWLSTRVKKAMVYYNNPEYELVIVLIILGKRKIIAISGSKKKTKDNIKFHINIFLAAFNIL